MASSGGIFHMTAAGDLVQLTPTAYVAEALLQGLLAQHPQLLPGDEMDPESPRRFLLVGREMSIRGDEAGVGFIDHVFVDQDGVPTFVEVKRATDTRARREVVGQLMDYVSNAVVHWGAEDLRAAFERTHTTEQAEAALEAFEPAGEVGRFWELVETNLRARKVRLMFVADEIPPTLRRIVEFLNEVMDPVDVLAVEVRQYVEESTGLTSLVPRLIGRTAAAGRKAAGSAGEPWTEERFFHTLRERDASACDIALDLVAWAREGRFPRIEFGRGKSIGALIPCRGPQGDALYPFILWTYGRIEMQFERMMRCPPFEGDEFRQELARRLEKIDGVVLPADRLAVRPSFELNRLSDQAARNCFKGAMEWAIERYDEYRQSSRSAPRGSN
ncbi:MAG TPA: hypothetical protein VL120_17270 [Solirubrobacteraceae bacterium]|nr:hypothetical protein [Solirubrobacteraceae bacterium]